ncbi:hypothetical protein L195_g042713, partial [Trifolium pratense]
SSKKQPIVTLSTTEAEFIAAAGSACQGVWLSRILTAIDAREKSCITIYCDNSSSIKLSKNPVMHGRSKHIDVRFHFLRDLTKEVDSLGLKQSWPAAWPAAAWPAAACLRARVLGLPVGLPKPKALDECLFERGVWRAGITQLKEFNTTLCYRVLVARYGEEAGRLMVGGRRGSTWWREVSRIRDGESAEGERGWF